MYIHLYFTLMLKKIVFTLLLIETYRLFFIGCLIIERLGACLIKSPWKQFHFVHDEVILNASNNDDPNDLTGALIEQGDESREKECGRWWVWRYRTQASIKSKKVLRSFSRFSVRPRGCASLRIFIQPGTQCSLKTKPALRDAATRATAKYFRTAVWSEGARSASNPVSVHLRRTSQRG